MLYTNIHHTRDACVFVNERQTNMLPYDRGRSAQYIHTSRYIHRDTYINTVRDSCMYVCMYVSRIHVCIHTSYDHTYAHIRRMCWV